MSNYLAIATATAALSKVLSDAITEIDGASVTIARPHASTDGNTPENPTVNLYLYQVTNNAAYRNSDLPSRNQEGRLRQKPQAALDLHYLLTFYGDTTQLEPERLLGIAVRALHSQPVLSRKHILATIDDEVGFPYLNGSDLDKAPELVKFTPVPFSLEELSKLWSVFLQTSYTLSIAYTGSVVLLEGDFTPSKPLPVRERSLYVLPFRQPVIEKVTAQNNEGKPLSVIDANATLVVSGRHLKGDTTTLCFNGVPLGSSAVLDISDSQILIKLSLIPVNIFILRAGVISVQVVHQLSLGPPGKETDHAGTESNAAAFLLQPIITVSTQTVGNNVEITVTTNPVSGEKQRAVLLLNGLDANDPKAYSLVEPSRKIDNPDDPNPVVSLVFSIGVSEITAGDYLVRLQLDGASSALEVENDEYVGPKVTLP